MKKIVITGGPCSGKTTTHEILKKTFPSQIVFVPECATALLEGCFPQVERDLGNEWSQPWQNLLEDAVMGAQGPAEAAWELIAECLGIDLLVCDRGSRDAAAYLAGGLAEYRERYKIVGDDDLLIYAAVIHMESLATADPDMYGKIGNGMRFETPERAEEIEFMTRFAWKDHPNYHFIAGTVPDGNGGTKTIEITDKINQVIEIVRTFLPAA